MHGVKNLSHISHIIIIIVSMFLYDINLCLAGSSFIDMQ